MIILKAEQLYRFYTDTQRRVEVIKGLDLEVAEGETVAIVGPSGAGKSTLLHMLGGIDVPDKGRILLDGKDLYRMNDRERAGVRNRDIGFVFQFYHLLPELSAIDNVLLPVFIKRNDSRRTPELLEAGVAALKDVGLVSRMEHKPHQLSGGTTAHCDRTGFDEPASFSFV